MPVTSPDSLWRDRDFVRYWAGQTVSQVGSQVTELALALVALFQLGASSTAVGLLRAVEFLPYLLLTLPVGVLADRRRRRPLMIGADLGRAVLLALVPLGMLLDLLSLPMLGAIALGAGALTVVFDVCVMALAPRARAVPVLIAGQVVMGGGIALFNLQSLSLRQAITPARLLGRVNAVVRLVGWGTIPVGAALGGWLGGAIGLRPMLALCAIGSMLTTALPLFSAVRGIDQTPAPEPVWSADSGAIDPVAP